MSEREGKGHLRRVGGSGSAVEFVEVLRDYTVLGECADIWNRFGFLQHQFCLTLQTAVDAMNKGDPEVFFRTLGKALSRASKLQMKMRRLLQQMPSREAYEQDVERMLTIFEEVVPGSRKEIARRLEEWRKLRS